MLKLMDQYQIRRLPVVREPHLVGMISEVGFAHYVSGNRIDHFVEI